MAAFPTTEAILCQDELEDTGWVRVNQEGRTAMAASSKDKKGTRHTKKRA